MYRPKKNTKRKLEQNLASTTRKGFRPRMFTCLRRMQQNAAVLAAGFTGHQEDIPTAGFALAAMITVEWCCNGNTEQLSTRHDPAQYRRHADETRAAVSAVSDQIVRLKKAGNLSLPILNLADANCDQDGTTTSFSSQQSIVPVFECGGEFSAHSDKKRSLLEQQTSLSTTQPTDQALRNLLQSRSKSSNGQGRKQQVIYHSIRTDSNGEDIVDRVGAFEVQLGMCIVPTFPTAMTGSGKANGLEANAGSGSIALQKVSSFFVPLKLEVLTSKLGSGRWPQRHRLKELILVSETHTTSTIMVW